MAVRVKIVFYSMYGHIYRLAEAAAGLYIGRCIWDPMNGGRECTGCVT